MYLSDLDLTGFRAVRDQLFATHAQSPIPVAERTAFHGLGYFPANPAAVLEAELQPTDGTIEIDTAGPDGVITYRRVGTCPTPWGPLTLWWLQAYGGGLFLPVRDGTCGTESYGGGRYLTDTVKGTFGRGVVDLGAGRLRLDFNYLYNPSCAYDDEWACPLAPPENRVEQRIEAGELSYHATPAG
ncbi:MAG: DUF1684 domain-containing protein [Jatrophihabitans sp.]